MSGWDQSAQAWIASLGERGDWSREHVLDPVMLGRLAGRPFEHALDVGCGEGRFCRMLKDAGIATIGIDPTKALIEEARRRDPDGDYWLGRAEALPFEAARFDLVVSYLTLIDIADFRVAIREMARVLKPGGTLLIANLTSFFSACCLQGWVKDAAGVRCTIRSTTISMSFPAGLNGLAHAWRTGIGHSEPTWRPFSTTGCSCHSSRSRSQSPAIPLARRSTGGRPGLW